MGLFGNLFGKTADSDKKMVSVPWLALENLEQLDAIVEKSNEKTKLIFKHSTTCGISRMVLNMFNNNYPFDDQVDAYFLDLHAYRAISNEVEQRFGIRHQSPQLLIVKNGEVTFHTSHGGITEVNLEELV